jgi:hypothetical protein
MDIEQARKDLRKLLLSRDTSRLSTALLSIAHDYLNYNYEMSSTMLVSMLNKLREQPKREQALLGETQ